MELVYTDGGNADFALLCGLLDQSLDELVGGIENRRPYLKYNLTHDIHDVLLAYLDGVPAGCASFRRYGTEVAEVKRVFVRKEFRGLGVAEILIRSLEEKASGKGYASLILETGRPLAAAMALYTKLGYEIIPNYDPYMGMEQSVCMGKQLGKERK